MTVTRPTAALVLMLGFTAAPTAWAQRDAVRRPGARTAVLAFVRTLDSAGARAALLPWSHAERTRWNRSPARRPGLSLGDMSPAQRAAMHDVLRRSLTERGYLRALAVIDNERRMSGVEEGMGSEYYWFVVFGDPAASGPWSWRLGGHHLSMHVTYNGDSLVAATPMFFGANPLRLDAREATGGRVLHGARREMALAVLGELPADARRRATIAAPAARGESRFVSEMLRPTPFPPPAGVPVRLLPEGARTLIAELLDDFLGDVRGGTHGPTLPDDLRFAIHVDNGPRGTFYYRLQSSQWLIEVEDVGNHLHSLLRSLADFGASSP